MTPICGQVAPPAQDGNHANSANAISSRTIPGLLCNMSLGVQTSQGAQSVPEYLREKNRTCLFWVTLSLGSSRGFWQYLGSPVPREELSLTTGSGWNTARNSYIAVLAGASPVLAPSRRGANALLLILNPKKQVWLVSFYKWLAQGYSAGNRQSRIITQVQILLPHHTTHTSSDGLGASLCFLSET